MKDCPFLGSNNKHENGCQLEQRSREGTKCNVRKTTEISKPCKTNKTIEPRPVTDTIEASSVCHPQQGFLRGMEHWMVQIRRHADAKPSHPAPGLASVCKQAIQEFLELHHWRCQREENTRPPFITHSNEFKKRTVAKNIEALSLRGQHLTLQFYKP